MIKPFGDCLAASYFSDLFRVDAGGGTYAFLPFLVTAIAVGVILAAACFTILRALEAAFLRRLTGAGAVRAGEGKTLSELGYSAGSLRSRWLLRLLHSPTCILYRNVSSDAYDRVKAQFAPAAGCATEGEDGGTGSAGDDAAAVTGGGGENASAAAETADLSPAPGRADDDERRARRAEARQQRRLGLKIAATDETRFYIPADRRAYVEERAAKFSMDDVMGLVYAVVATTLLWFILLNVLDPLLKLLTK